MPENVCETKFFNASFQCKQAGGDLCWGLRVGKSFSSPPVLGKAHSHTNTWGTHTHTQRYTRTWRRSVRVKGGRRKVTGAAKAFPNCWSVQLLMRISFPPSPAIVSETVDTSERRRQLAVGLGGEEREGGSWVYTRGCREGGRHKLVEEP